MAISRPSAQKTSLAEFCQRLMSRRLQLALNVNDIGEAVACYAKLFGTEPAKLRPGYASFAIAEPSSSSCWKTPARAAA
jgi:hypothetical protein